MSLGSEKKGRMELETGEEEDIQSLINHTKMVRLCPQAKGSCRRETVERFYTKVRHWICTLKGSFRLPREKKY